MTKNGLQKIDILNFQFDLLTWYYENARDLPWRKDQDPYKVWVSEIMLQQTRVDTVIPYFNRFMKDYPTIFDLAAAEEQEILKGWEGLGYYSRARNLHEAAKEVVASYGGLLPRDGKKLEKLKGIGPYTKGAIMSIAFNEPEPAVDGNVMRVLSRILLETENISEYRTRGIFESYVRDLISEEDPASFNQGLMELGALICKPKNPACEICPVRRHCRAYEEGVQGDLPVRTRAKKQRVLPYASLLIKNEAGEYLIEQRPERGLLANMWQFPMVPIYEIGKEHLETYFMAEYGLQLQVKEKLSHIRHVFSHLIWEIDVFSAETGDRIKEGERLRFVSPEDFIHYPFPVPHLKMRDLID